MNINPISILLGLLGIGGLAYGIDQHEKLRKEQFDNRMRLHRLESKLATKEAELAQLISKLGEKNHQVQTLASEVKRLRSERATLKQVVSREPNDYV
jgi:capsule polysaccharide export protein KpsE/RkpR